MSYIGIFLLLVALFSFFHWIKKKRYKRENKMNNYGIEVTSDTGKITNITDKALMLMDILNIQYGIDGNKTYPINIVSVVRYDNTSYSFGIEGKLPQFSINGKTLSWKWVNCTNVKSNNATILIFC